MWYIDFMIIDKYELFGDNPQTGERHCLGAVQLDRAQMNDPERRHEGIGLVVRFAVGSQFTDGSRPVNADVVLATSYDVCTKTFLYNRYTGTERPA